jgi:sugar (pentulose or hexulose) kinase
MHFLGIDLGTGGVRVIICDERGSSQASCSIALQGAKVSDLPPGFHEQRVETWWPAALQAIVGALRQFKKAGRSPREISAIGITSTSGTVVPLDEHDEPLRSALMYNDARAIREAEELNEKHPEFLAKAGWSFQPSFALPKILWVMRREPQVARAVRRWAHAGDYLVGRLTGEFGASDYSTALKTGYDLLNLCWPPFLETAVGLPPKAFPRVLAPGEAIGTVCAAAARQTGLRRGTVVCAGMTDASAALFAAGACEPGDWNTALGTTLGIKGITRSLLRDPHGRVYSHRHPMGFWLPGAASNVGGDCLEAAFPGRDLPELDGKAWGRGPSSVLLYPLARRGERFPFVRPQAEGFRLGQPRDEIDLYRGHLEGVAFTERLGYEVLVGLGAETGARIHATGGGSRSPVWLQIRADVLGKTLIRPRLPESAFGAALLAASNIAYRNVTEAVHGMVRIDSVCEPRSPDLYEEKYRRFREACRERGYIE